MASERKKSSERKKPGALISVEDYNRAIRKNLTQQQKGDLLDELIDLAEMVIDPSLSSDDLVEYQLPEPKSEDPMIRIAYGLMGGKVVSNIQSFKQRSETNSANAAAGKGSSGKGDDGQQSLATDNVREQSSAVVSVRGEKKRNRKEKEMKGREEEAEAEKKATGLPETVLDAAAAAGFKNTFPLLAGLKHLVEKYGEETVITAIDRANENSSPGDDKRSLSYLRKACEGIESDRQESETGLIDDWD